MASSRTHGDRRLHSAVNPLSVPSSRSRATLSSAANVPSPFSRNSTVRRMAWFKGRYALRSVAQSSVRRCLAMTSQSATSVSSPLGPDAMCRGATAHHGQYSGGVNSGQTRRPRRSAVRPRIGSVVAGSCRGSAMLGGRFAPGDPEGDFAMRDPRNAKLAQLIVNYSTRLAPGEAMLIESFDLADGLVLDLVDAAYAAQGIPLVFLRSNAVN